MKAVLYEKSSRPDKLVCREINKPTPNYDEVLVKIYAAAVNAADYRSMKMRIIPKKKIFGADISGRVEAVGKNIKRFAVGDEVLGDTASFGFGGFAEYVAVSERALVRKPANLPFNIAAAVPLSAVTALQSMRNEGCIQSGYKVLICGAGGGVGTYAVQLARNFGAEVTAVCGKRNAQIVKSLGAEHIIDYTETDFTKCGGQYDLILAVNGNNSMSSYRRLLAPKGVLVVIGGALSQLASSMVFGPLLSLGGRKIKVLSAKPSTEDLEYLVRLVEEGKLKPIIDRYYTLDQTAEAMRYTSEGHALGKVVINISEA